jgi:hypothetical protein
MATRKKKSETALVLRCCNSDMSSKNGFVWPGVGGIATAPDWKDDGECGSGLHGWLYGQGDHNTSDYWNQIDAKWLVVEVKFSSIRMLGGKCKFQRGKVVFIGTKSEAADYIVLNEPQAANVSVIGLIAECGEGGVLQGGALSVLTGGYSATMTGGNSATMTGGNSATMTGGYSAKMTGGNYATMIGGNYATMTGGHSAKMTGGESATMTGGESATMTGGYSATMTGGNSATMTGGNYATMTGGYSAKMTGGESATMTGGHYATMTGGNYATMHFAYFDGKRDRTVIGYVGEDGIKPNIAYILDSNHKIVEVIK